MHTFFVVAATVAALATVLALFVSGFIVPLIPMAAGGVCLSIAWFLWNNTDMWFGGPDLAIVMATLFAGIGCALFAVSLWLFKTLFSVEPRKPVR